MINEVVTQKTELFEEIRRARARLGQGASSAPTLEDAAAPQPLAQGDSWFNYWIGHDILYWLGKDFGWKVDSIAVAGSTLNDVVYGPVPKDLLDFRQSDAPSRLDELVYRIQKDQPPALLLSVGGNDVAGDPFFSFINNEKADLPHTNEEVLDGVVDRTFAAAYRLLIKTALSAADAAGNRSMFILTHGYDYPWPDGRGILWIKGLIGPWFDSTFNAKNYALKTLSDLQSRHDILKTFIDKMNEMLIGMQAEFSGRMFHVDTRNTLRSDITHYRDQWANELHPTDDGFRLIAAKVGAVLRSRWPK